MDFADAIPVAFKEITPNYNVSDKWKEIVLNTGGTHSTLQDIKLPQKGGGYWYEDTVKQCTRNRFIYWQTTPDSIELSEASFDLNLSSCNLRCKVAPGTPPLNNMTVYERPNSKEVIILAATVSSVHRLVFPHPSVLDKRSTYGSMTTTSPSIFQDTSAVNNPNNYYILNQYSNSTTGVAHTCASLLRDNGEAVFALAFGQGGDSGLLLVKLPVTGTAVTTLLKRESTMPRFLSGITGALRGKSDGVETYGVVILHGITVAICGDNCLRAWGLDEGGAPVAVSQPLTQSVARPRPPPHGHVLQKAIGPDGGLILVAYLSFPEESEFVVLKVHDGGAGSIKFSHVSRIFGPQLDLLDFTIGYGDGGNVIWALWSQPDGETVITTVQCYGACGGAELRWSCVAAAPPPAPLPRLPAHAQYRAWLLQRARLQPAVVERALVIYRRTWGGAGGAGGAGGGAGGAGGGAGGDLGDSAVAAVQARLRQLAARTPDADPARLMHKCWSDLYSWCMQYMEGLQKPLGLMAPSSAAAGRSGASDWWCGVVRRCGPAVLRPLDPLERVLLAGDAGAEAAMSECGVSDGAARLVAAAARWERLVSADAAAALEAQLFAASPLQHRLLPRLLLLLQQHAMALTPAQVSSLTALLEPIRDVQSAVLELNDALRLDVPPRAEDEEEEECNEYDTLFASDLGVAVVVESIRQMAEMRARVVRGALVVLALWRGAGGVPGAGHCAVHWQAYRALSRAPPPPAPRPAGSSELFRLKLSVLGGTWRPQEACVGAGGPLAGYARGAGGRGARLRLRELAASAHWPDALPLYTYHLAHQLWAVSGGFEFGWWLASINQPQLVQAYVAALEPWCEWNACSRQFILGLALLDLQDPEGAYTAFCKAAKGVSSEPFLRQLACGQERATHQQARVLYYVKVIKLFEIHEAGACVVRLAETAISIADADDPNLPMFQWVVFKWHLSGGRVERALSAARAQTAPHARHAAAAALLAALARSRQLGALAACGALAGAAQRAAASRAQLHDAAPHNPYYDFLFASHVQRHHYRRAAAVSYERASRCLAEGALAARRRHLAAALACLRLARPEHAFLARPDMQIIGPEELAAELRQEDPDAMDPIQKSLLNKGSEGVDFSSLEESLRDATAEQLAAIARRAVSAGQFLPHWFLLKYLESDSAGLIRALLSGGRLSAAAAACARAVRAAGRALPAAAPARAPLALADLVLAELTHQPQLAEAYEDLDGAVKEYTQVVIRTSEDMKAGQLVYATGN